MVGDLPQRSQVRIGNSRQRQELGKNGMSPGFCTESQSLDELYRKEPNLKRLVLDIRYYRINYLPLSFKVFYQESVIIDVQDICHQSY